jgi:hypothetical protein
VVEVGGQGSDAAADVLRRRPEPAGSVGHRYVVVGPIG